MLGLRTSALLLQNCLLAAVFFVQRKLKIMNQVKEYKGVKIFVSTQGEFYCDANTNSSDYKNKTFISTKLQSVEKAIDDFKGQEIDGNRYYDIAVYNRTITPLKIVRQVGNRLFFNDGTDTSNYSRKALYPKSVDETNSFKELKLLFEQLRENQKEVDKLYEIQKQLRAEADKKIKMLSKVVVSANGS